MQTKSEIQQSNEIHFKSNELENSLKKYGYFKQGKITIYQLLDFDQYLPHNEYILPEEDFVFAFENKDENIPFLGVVNVNFQRFGYCLNTHSNGDIYFGYYLKDKMNKKGLYSFKPKIEDKYKLSQYYFGSWLNNLFEGIGIYIWLKENKDLIPFSDFDNSSFDAFIGNSEKGVFKKGVLLKYYKNNFLVYYGSFSGEGKKEGNNCFYYNNYLEEMCFGTYKNDKFIEGFVAKFNKEEGKMINLIIYKREENKKPEGQKIKIENEKNVEYIMSKFRKVILSKDYCKIIYDDFKNLIQFRDEKMNDINNILDNNKYEKIINKFESNKFNLYKDIEKSIPI